jgi:hypothetical protein
MTTPAAVPQVMYRLWGCRAHGRRTAGILARLVAAFLSVVGNAARVKPAAEILRGLPA